MPKPIDARRIDEVCAYFRKYADTIERLLAIKNKAVQERIMEVVGTVGEAKRQLEELASLSHLPGMSAERAAVVQNLRNRYERLEGALKELRNDLSRNGRRRTDAVKPLQPFSGEDEQ